ncbi:MAG: calcium-binding protein [Nostoc sp.]|uniref:calcium-binding protein n=1 Tax=Nostoc sp. TaxID=1180 RepID=UPI002FFB350E
MVFTYNGTSGNDSYDQLTSYDVKAYGYEGNDFIWTGSGNDSIYGGSGDDTLKGWSGNDYLFGDTGNDYLYGETGDDTLDGWSGNDTVYGGDGKDLLYGYDGNDYLYGDAGNDTIYGEAGNDYIKGGSGQDVLYGGAGADQFVFDSVYDGVDIIKDFQWTESDKIQISKSGFGASSNSQFSYDYNNGNLFYNGTLFATIDNKPSGFSTNLDIALV